MTSSCPHCGTHIGSIADAKDTIISPVPAPQQRDSEQPSGSQQPSGANPVSPHLDSGKDDLDSNKDDLDLSTKQSRIQLKRLICKCPCYGGTGGFAKYLSFRQYLCVGYLGSAKPGRPWETLDRTTTKMYDAICCTGAVSVKNLFASRLLGLSSLYISCETVFQAIGAIVYDMEWTNDDGELVFQNAEALADAKHTISPNFKLGYDGCQAVLEHMLLIDYGYPGVPVFRQSTGSSLSSQELDLWSFERFSGFLVATAWRWKQGHAIPDQEAWDLIERVLDGSGHWSKDFTWDAAIMCTSNPSRFIAPSRLFREHICSQTAPEKNRKAMADIVTQSTITTLVASPLAPRPAAMGGQDTPGSCKR